MCFKRDGDVLYAQWQIVVMVTDICIFGINGVGISKTVALKLPVTLK